MGRVSNETNLIIALLKEKATARKSLLTHIHPKDARLQKMGINWTLNALDEIIQNEIVKK